MLPEKCCEQFAKAWGHYHYIKPIIKELEEQSKQKKYDVKKVLQLIESIRSHHYSRFKQVANLLEWLAWLEKAWPLAVENAPRQQMVTQSSSFLPVLSSQPSPQTPIQQEPTLEDLRKRLQPLAQKWKFIKITDIPTEKHGIYQSVGNDAQTHSLRLFATQRIPREVKRRAEQHPCYWIDLGRLAKKKEEGRCFTCAAVAIYDLILSENWDDTEIIVGGSEAYDHCFVKISLGKKSFALDIWHSNLNKSYLYIYDWLSYPYIHKFREMCRFAPGERKSHRSLAKDVA